MEILLNNTVQSISTKMNKALSTKILQGPGTASGTVLQKRRLRTFALNPGLIYLQKVLKNLFLNLKGEFSSTLFQNLKKSALSLEKRP